MRYELKDIKQIRKKAGLTQNQFAKRANVSQSLIAKIEAGRLDPTYSNTKRIFAALDSISEKEQIKAKDIMKRRLITVKPEDSIHGAIKKMRKSGISQMPVIEKHNCIGLITETAIINKMGDVKDMKELNAMKVKDVMKECPPIISKKANKSIISELLRVYQVILVSEKGRLVGLITKADMLGKIYKS
jgi:predicted transcriptional regulator